MSRKQSQAAIPETIESKPITGEQITSANTIISQIVRYGFITLWVRYGYLAIASLAGKITKTDIILSLLSNAGAGYIIGGLFGTGGITYGKRQNKLRKKSVEHLEKHIKELEKQIDPNRTSSNLTKHGETNPEDRL